MPDAAAVHRKIFVIQGGNDHERNERSCEVYNEVTNEWHLIASLKISSEFCSSHVAGAMCVDDKLYALGEYSAMHFCERRATRA